jgi:hypothetical protein
MNSDRSHPTEKQTEVPAVRAGGTTHPVAEGVSPQPTGPVAGDPAAPEAVPPGPAGSLTPEEQMALFAKELKENDWGHQPC